MAFINVNKIVFSTTLAAGLVIEENYLGEVITFDFLASCEVSGLFLVGVDVNHLSVTLVSEKEAFFSVSLYAEVRAFVHLGTSGHPVKVAQVGLLQLESFVAAKNLREVFLLHSVRKVNIGALLVLAIFLVADIKDAGGAAISKSLFSFLQSLKEFRLFDVALAADMGQSLHIDSLPRLNSLLVSFFLFSKGLSTQDFAFSVVAHFDELAGELLVFEVKQVIFGHLGV